MTATGTATRRWDGRSWMVRAAGASLAPTLAPFLGLDRGLVLRLALLTAFVWMPAISISERVRLRWPGVIPVAASALADIVMVGVLTVVAPAMTPVLVIAILPSALVHSVDLPHVGRWVLVAAIGALQLATGGATAGVIGVEVLTADIVTGLGATLLLGHVERDRQSARAALDQMGELTDAVLAGIGEAVVVTDRNGLVASANAAAESTFGQAVAGPCSQALALAKGAADLDCSKGCPLLGADGQASQVDVERHHPSGRRQALLVNVRALRDPLGRIRTVVHSFRDVTSLKEADQAKTLFLATASHELKTPLSVIGGFADLLANDRIDDPDTRRKALSTIVERTKQLTAIVERLLLASKIDGGGVRITVEPVDLGRIGAERVADIDAVNPHAITWDAPTPLPPVKSEPVALATIIDHLVENAVKYSPDGGDIAVVATVDATHVTVDVMDHGIGMSPDHAAHCFEPFWQAEGTDTRRFGGSGIGLYIVDSLVDAMGGTVTVPRAIPGEGTTIRVQLDRADIEQRDVQAGIERTHSATSQSDLMRQAGLTTDRR